MSEVFYFIKNGVWDDPAASVGGGIYTYLLQKSQERGLHERVAPMFTWRFCYLMCGCVFWIAATVLTVLDLLDSNTLKAKYENFLTQISPQYIPQESFSDLIDFLVMLEYGLVGVSSFALLIYMVGLWFARPSVCIDSFHRSKFLNWLAWTLNFFPMFIVFLVYPARTLVDWESLVQNLCEQTIQGAMMIPGSQLAEGLAFFHKHGLLDDGFAGVEFTQDMSTSITNYCLHHGKDWNDMFFGESTTCIFDLESRLRDLICPTHPDPFECLGSVWSIASDTYDTAFVVNLIKNDLENDGICQGNVAQAKAMERMIENGGDIPAPTCVDKPPAWWALQAEALDNNIGSCAQMLSAVPTLCERGWEIKDHCCRTCKNQRRLNDLGVNIDPELLERTTQMLDLAANAMDYRRLTMQTLSDVANEVLVQSQYVVGVLIGLVCGKTLIPASLSLLGGLSEAVLNTKATFPGIAFLGYLLAFICFESIPVNIAILAVFEQTIGDEILSISCVLIVMYLSLSIMTGLRIVRTTESERERVYSTVWQEYIIRFLLLWGIVGTLIWFALSNSHEDILEYIKTDLLSAQVIIPMLLTVYSKKILTAVAGTDLLIIVFSKSMIWQYKNNDTVAQQEQIALMSDVRNLSLLNRRTKDVVSIQPPVNAEEKLS